jgi:hypothetical protein
MSKFKTKIINIKALSHAAGVSIHKMYRRRYVPDAEPMELTDRTKLVNELIKESIRLSKELGFVITVTHSGSPKANRKKAQV